MKPFAARGDRCLVVDFGRAALKLAAIERAGDAVAVLRLGRVERRREGGGERAREEETLALRLADEVARNGWRGWAAVGLLPREAVHTQTFLLPPMPVAELRRALALKLEESLPFPLDQACFDFRCVPTRQAGEQAQTLVRVSAARREALEHARALLRRAGLRPRVLVAAGEALAALTALASPRDGEEASVHVDIGSESTLVNLFDGRVLRFCRELDSGGEAFTLALMRPVQGTSGVEPLTRAEAEELKRSVGIPREDAVLPRGLVASEVRARLEPIAQRLASEIQLSSQYLAGVLGRARIDRVVLTGPGARLPHLPAALEENLDVPVTRADPLERALAHWRLSLPCEPAEAAGYGALLGYALGAEQTIDLLAHPRRQALFATEPRRLRTAAVPAALALGALSALAAVPIQREDDSTRVVLEETSRRLDELLSARAGGVGRALAARTTLARLVVARGPVPEWENVLKELSAALPEPGRIVRLLAEVQGGRTVLTVVGQLDGASTGWDARVARVVLALGASPFFARTDLVTSEAPAADGPGEFELRLELEAFERTPGGGA